MDYRTYKLQLGAATALALSFAAPSYARAAEPAADSSDIVVTARRIEERLQDVPVAVTVYNQQQLTDANISSTAQLAAFTPSLFANTRFGADNTLFSLRGFYQDNGTAPTVGTYFADVQAPRGNGFGSPAGDGAGPGTIFDLQNIQILKGPQGTLFGRNTTGGAILIVPQKPTTQTEGYIEGSYGNYNMRRVQGAVNLPINDSIRARIGGDYQKRDGFQRNWGFGQQRPGSVNYWAVRGSLVVDITDNLENYSIFSYAKSQSVSAVTKLLQANPTQPGLLDPSGPTNALNQLNAQIAGGYAGFYDVVTWQPDSRNKSKRWQFINTTTWKVSDYIQIKNILSYASLKGANRSQLFGSGFGTAASPSIRAETRPITGGLSAASTTFIEEVQLQGSTPDDKFQYQGGVYYESVKPIQPVGGMSGNRGCINGELFFCPVTGGSVNFQAGELTMRNVGVYGQGTYSITDKLKFTAGLRYTWDYQKMWNMRKTYNVTAGGVVVPFRSNVTGQDCTEPSLDGTNCIVLKTAKSDAPTWIIGLDWKPSEDVLLYAKWSRGYRTGGLIQATSAAYNSYKPEKLNTFEIGAKTSFRGPIPGTLNVALFDNMFQNQQLQVGLNADLTQASPSAAIVNLAKSKITGADVDLMLKPFTGFTLNVNYSYLNGKIKSVGTLPTDPTGVFSANVGSIQAGDRLLFMPKHKFAITANYVLPFSEDIGKISLGATFTHTDSQMVNYDNRLVGVPLGSTSFVKGNNLLNANLNWKGVFGSPVDFGLFATNLTNKKYLHVITGSQSGPFGGLDYGVQGEPRMYGARLKYSFGN